MTDDAALVCHTLGLGKSQIASLLGVTRAALYDCLKGHGSLQPEPEHRLRLLADLLADVATPVQRPLFHAFIEQPLPGQRSSILDQLRQAEWNREHLRSLLREARRLTTERDRRIASSTPAKISEHQRRAIYLDNLIAMGQG